MSERGEQWAGSKSGCGGGVSAMQGGVPAEEQGSISNAGKIRDGEGLTKCIDYVKLISFRPYKPSVN